MQSSSLAKGLPSDLPAYPSERRNKPRFNMHLPVLAREVGGQWAAGETADVSATGAFFVTDRPFLLDTSIEYVLTFPPELTKAPRPLRVRFFGKLLRCERVYRGRGSFGITVSSTDHRYLNGDQSASFDAIEQELQQPSADEVGFSHVK